MAIIGIDLGTTNSLAATYKDGESVLIPNEFGEYLTPSVVHISKDNNVIVGKSAKEMLVVDPDNTISVFKRSMGLNKKFHLRNRNYSPEELSAFVIKKLVEDAKRELQEEIEEVIISVPAYFDDMRRKATKRAGEIAGVKVDRLINEPSAAVLACRMEDEGEDCVYLVFDFGGGTLDVSIVECFDNVISVNAVSGDNHLGGSDFDNIIARYICEQFSKNFDKLSKEDQSIILKKAEQLKKELSKENAASITIESETINGSVSLTHDKLVELSSKLFNRIKKPVRQALNDSDFALDEISKIILVGGSSKMTVVNMYLYYLFQIELYSFGNPDETVAKGLGFYAGMKERNKNIRDIVMTDVCPFSLGVDTLNEADPLNPYFSPIIERNSTLPISKIGYYTTTHNRQKAIELNIYQGDERFAKQNLFLDKIEVSVKPRPAGDENIMVRFTYDLNGILDVDVEVLSNHAKFKKTIINKNMDLSKEEIKEQLKKMEELKKDPRTKEENQYLLALANALYRETSGQLRDYIDSIIRYFDNVLMEGNEQKIDYVRKRLMVVLSNLEAGLYDYSFNEEEYDSEDYNEEEEFLNNMRSGNTEEAQMDKDDLEEDNFLSMLKEPPEDDI